jgi:hypothetical protein
MRRRCRITGDALQDATVGLPDRRKDGVITAAWLQLRPEAMAAVAAVAVVVQREADAWAARYPGLWNPALSTPLALTYALTVPWRRADELRLAVRFSHWLFWADDAVEAAERDSDVGALVERSGAVAAGACPSAGDALGQALADIRRELVAKPLWPALGARWRESLVDTLTGYGTQRPMARAVARGLPTPSSQEYLSLPIGYEVCRVCFWLSAEDHTVLEHLDTLSIAIGDVDRALRIANDLRTHERERDRLDINLVKLGTDPATAARWMTDAITRADAVLQPLADRRVRAAVEISRHMRFVVGLYGATDYR